MAPPGTSICCIHQATSKAFKRDEDTGVRLRRQSGGLPGSSAYAWAIGLWKRGAVFEGYSPWLEDCPCDGAPSRSTVSMARNGACKSTQRMGAFHLPRGGPIRVHFGRAVMDGDSGQIVGSAR
jgi:hypothetical protein